MDLKQLEYIVGIAEEKNITKAAKKLYITQSALNQTLLKLEKEIGEPLFERSKLNLYLTEIGKIYVEQAKKILEIRKETYEKIDEILLVGGSTRMPQIKRALTENFGGIEIKILEPDEAVAKGAAIHAVNVYVNNQKSLAGQDFESDKEVTVMVNGDEKELRAKDYKEDLTFSPEMMEIGGNTREIVIATTKSFAVKVENKDGVNSCFNMIVKNEPMPSRILEVSGNFTTLNDNQETVDIEIYENDYMDKYFDVDEDLKIGNAILELPENLPAGSLVEITLKLNKEGILEIRGRDKFGNKEVNVKLETKSVISKEKLEKLTNKSQGIAVL